MDDIAMKYRKLDKAGQQELQIFLDFFLYKISRKKRAKPVKSYREKLLEGPTWSEKDIEEFQRIRD